MPFMPYRICEYFETLETLDVMPKVAPGAIGEMIPSALNSTGRAGT
jgi:hypothetical protein